MVRTLEDSRDPFLITRHELANFLADLGQDLPDGVSKLLDTLKDRYAKIRLYSGIVNTRKT